MRSKVMMAPNPHRSMMIDRVVVVGRSDDGVTVSVLSIDGIQNDEWAKRNFTKYFLQNALWNLLALTFLAAGVALSFIWKWWIFVPSLVLAGWAGYRGKVSGATAGERILKDHPWARERLSQNGLLWEAPSESVVES